MVLYLHQADYVGQDHYVYTKPQLWETPGNSHPPKKNLNGH